MSEQQAVHGGPGVPGVGAAYGGARSKVVTQSGNSAQHNRFARDRLLSLSEKRKADGDAASHADNPDNSTANNGEFQYPPRRRKVNYGKCSIDVAGGEAAPYEVFVGNTNPGSTPEIIEEVLKKCADMLPGEQKLAEPLQVLQVKCMTRPNENGDPLRTKCWMVQVPNKFREHMLRGEAYPNGWSHRRYFPKRPQKNSVPALDPTAQAPKRPHVSEASEGAPTATAC